MDKHDLAIHAEKLLENPVFRKAIEDWQANIEASLMQVEITNIDLMQKLVLSKQLSIDLESHINGYIEDAKLKERSTKFF